MVVSEPLRGYTSPGRLIFAPRSHSWDSSEGARMRSILAGSITSIKGGSPRHSRAQALGRGGP